MGVEKRHCGQRARPLETLGSSLEMQSPCFRLCQAGAGKRAFCHHRAPGVRFVYPRPELQTFFHLFPPQWLPLPRPRFQASAPPGGPKAGGEGGVTFPTQDALSLSICLCRHVTFLRISVSIIPICLSEVFWCLHLCVSLSLSPRLSASLWACASVSLTQEFGAPVFRSQPCPLCMASAPCPLPGSFGLYQTGMTMALTGSWGLSETGAAGAWPYSNLQLHKGLDTPFFFFFSLLPKVSARS